MAIAALTAHEDSASPTRRHAPISPVRTRSTSVDRARRRAGRSDAREVREDLVDAPGPRARRRTTALDPQRRAPGRRGRCAPLCRFAQCPRLGLGHLGDRSSPARRGARSARRTPSSACGRTTAVMSFMRRPPDGVHGRAAAPAEGTGSRACHDSASRRPPCEPHPACPARPSSSSAGRSEIGVALARRLVARDGRAGTCGARRPPRPRTSPSMSARRSPRRARGSSSTPSRSTPTTSRATATVLDERRAPSTARRTSSSLAFGVLGDQAAGGVTTSTTPSRSCTPTTSRRSPRSPVVAAADAGPRVGGDRRVLLDRGVAGAARQLRLRLGEGRPRRVRLRVLRVGRRAARVRGAPDAGAARVRRRAG